MQVRKKDTQRIYALKTIRKAHIASRPGEITHILAERTVLALVNSPFIVPLKFSFQTPDKLYLVMSFGKCHVLANAQTITHSKVNGGELFYHLQREGKFDVNRSRFYAAELLCALEQYVTLALTSCYISNGHIVYTVSMSYIGNIDLYIPACGLHLI